MKIIVTGCKGQLGTEMHQAAAARAAARSAPSRKSCSMQRSFRWTCRSWTSANYKMVDDFIRRQRPDVIINCAAYTNVDGCEVNHDAAYKANAIGPRNLAQAADQDGCPPGACLHRLRFLWPGERRHRSG